MTKKKDHKTLFFAEFDHWRATFNAKHHSTGYIIIPKTMETDKE